MVSGNLVPKFHSEIVALSLSPLPPPPPQESVPLAHFFFVLLAMNGPLPAELKFRENTVQVITIQIYSV